MGGRGKDGDTGEWGAKGLLGVGAEREGESRELR